MQLIHYIHLRSVGIALLFSAEKAATFPLDTFQANMTATGPNSTVVNVAGTLIPQRDPDSEADSDFQKSIHLSVSLASMIVLLVLMSRVRNHGYTLSRSPVHSTDSEMFIAMGLISFVWTAFILFSSWVFEDENSRPCREDPHSAKCAARLGFAPWILDGVFLWRFIHSLMHEISCSHHGKCASSYLKRLFRPRTDSGCSDYDLSLAKIQKTWTSWIETTIVFAIIAAPISWTIYGAIKTELFTLGMLTIAALVILFHGLSAHGHYLTPPHRYYMDEIRVPLLTPVESGIVYVLPSRKYGFDAIYSPRLDAEQAILEKQRHLFEPMDIVRKEWSLDKCRAAVREVVMSRVRSVKGDGDMTRALGWWLYYEGKNEEVLPINCTARRYFGAQAPKKFLGKILCHPWMGLFRHLILVFGRNIPWSNDWVKIVDRLDWTKFRLKSRRCKRREKRQSLIGRDVVLALLQWEYIVFERRWQLEDDIRHAVWRLREPKYTAAGAADQLVEGMKTMGSAGGMKGFQEAAGEVYRILGDLDPDEKTENELGSFSSSTLENSMLEINGVMEAMKGTWKKRRGESIAFETKEIKWGLEGDFTIVKGWKKFRDFEGPAEYAAALWDKCWDQCPSTFGALFLWTTVWYIDIGNSFEGFHSTPLIPAESTRGFFRDGSRDKSVWRMSWRHTWHTAIICQLVVMLPTLISTVFAIIGTA